MSEKNLGILIFTFLIIINLAGFIYFSIIIYKNIKLRRQQAKKINELESKKCKGPHSWINMSVDGSRTHVCKKCYFSPSHDGFVKQSFVQEAIYTEQFDIQYKEYFDKKIQELAFFYEMPIDKLAEIGEKIIQIKKDFAFEYIKKMMEEVSQGVEKE
jgi:hypothetical protein